MKSRSMALVGVGIATIDIIQEVDAYPEEDSKIRAIASRKTRGGNVTNALAISAQLGCACYWLGTMTDPARDSDAAFVSENLQSFGLDASCATILPSGAMPVSYIVSSKATGSRTIIHHRDLPELSVDSFCESYSKIATSTSKHNSDLWVHFEGRNLANVEIMMQFLNSNKEGGGISLEVEALRNDWDHVQRLLKLADVVFVSKDYIRHKLGLGDAAAFFIQLRSLRQDDWRPRVIICPWGPHGVYYMDMTTQREHHAPTVPLEHTVDSVGAGDSFIGAALAAFAHNVSLHEAVRAGCRVATAKCGQHGFHLPRSLCEEVLASYLGN